MSHVPFQYDYNESKSISVGIRLNHFQRKQNQSQSFLLRITEITHNSFQNKISLNPFEKVCRLSVYSISHDPSKYKFKSTNPRTSQILFNSVYKLVPQSFFTVLIRQAADIPRAAVTNKSATSTQPTQPVQLAPRGGYLEVTAAEIPTLINSWGSRAHTYHTACLTLQPPTLPPLPLACPQVVCGANGLGGQSPSGIPGQSIPAPRRQGVPRTG